MTMWQKFKMGLKLLPAEFKKYGQEWRDHFKPVYYEKKHLTYMYQWNFQSQDDVSKWVSETQQIFLEDIYFARDLYLKIRQLAIYPIMRHLTYK